MNLETMTALELGAAIRKGEISAVEAAKFSLAQIILLIICRILFYFIHLLTPQSHYSAQQSLYQ